MRELKFRAWDGRVMLSNVDIMRGQAIRPSHSGTFWTDDAKAGIAMQSTGLKDRNGVEIWGGDLLEEEAGYLFEVVWDEEWAKFRLQWRTKAIQYPEWNRGKKMAVVGNIYQHSHLLEPQ